jgi:hypothetical protein
VNAPGRADVDRLDAYAHENLRLADAAADDAERHGRLKQAGAAFRQAGRITDGLAEAVAPPQPGRWGMDMVLPGSSARGALSGPGLR